ncbi:hypothetical protein GH714_039020 [Hevea brasiliensis]|uniref:HMA domain-containing protein n=1 Tax=Hevea brasiliensis TaxID=3981 RepID=A0A6A6KNN3_HEVBR|nr:hypothetical protein GH714_039020 [Hevea brasiliensis]
MSAEKKPATDDDAKVISVYKMDVHCEGCAKKIRLAVEQLEGADSFSFSEHELLSSSLSVALWLKDTCSCFTVLFLLGDIKSSFSGEGRMPWPFALFFSLIDGLVVISKVVDASNVFPSVTAPTSTLRRLTMLLHDFGDFLIPVGSMVFGGFRLMAVFLWLCSMGLGLLYGDRF